jgi:hypothetical protein
VNDIVVRTPKGQAVNHVGVVCVNDTAHSLRIFEHARREIADAETADQVKRILALATGLAAAAREATDSEMETEAEVLKLEAERKLGQLMQEQKETVGLNKGGRPKTGFVENPVSSKPTLTEAGINKNLAHRARTAAAMPASDFEVAKESKRKSITAKPKTRPKQKKTTAQVASSLTDRCVETVAKTIERTIGEMRRGHAPQKKYELLFAALGDVISDLERKTLLPVVDATACAEERKAGDARCGAEEDPRLDAETAAENGGAA